MTDDELYFDEDMAEATIISSAKIDDNANNDSSILMSEFSNVRTRADLPPDDLLPTIFNGRYFKIIETITDTLHQKRATGVIAACQLCANHKKLRGSLKITSNFVQHIKTKHPYEYEEYILEKPKKRLLLRRLRKHTNPISTAANVARDSNSDVINETHGDTSTAYNKISRISIDSASVGSGGQDSNSIWAERPLIINGKYFKVIKHIRNTVHQRSAGGVIVTCQFCAQNNKLKGSIKITSNFVQHLKTIHPSQFQEYLLEKAYNKIWSKLEANECDKASSTSKTGFRDPMEAECMVTNEPLEMSTNGPRLRTEGNDKAVLVMSSPSDISCHSLEGTPLILNGKYFKIVNQVADTADRRPTKGVIAVCQFCPKNNSITGSLEVTANFVEHLKDVHRKHYEEYILENTTQAVTVKEEPEWNEPNEEFSDDSSTAGSSISSGSTHSALETKGIDQSNFDKKLLTFIVDSFASSLIVENSSFLKLFDNNPYQVKTPKLMTKLLSTKLYERIKTDIKDRLRNVKHVCTTVDNWSCKNNMFFGYACHWIDSSLNRQSLALACRRFTGTPTVDKIVDLVECINKEFGLVGDKLACTIVENSENLRDAFVELGTKDIVQGNAEFVSVSPPNLPKQQGCGGNTLSGLATIEFINIIKSNDKIYAIHQSSMQRCSSIWDRCKRPETTYIMEILLNCSLKTPKATRWNSLFDALKHLLEHKQNLDDLCLALNVPKFHPTEVKYLDEYCSLMEPIANALNFLADEKNMFYGYFLPTLVTTKVKLRKFNESRNLDYLKDITQQMEKALVGRFRNFFELRPECHNAVVAAISCPAVKLGFIKPLNASLDDLKLLFIKYAMDFEPEANQFSRGVSEHSFFDFDQSTQESVQQRVASKLYIEKEVSRYLKDDDCSWSCLRRYPVIKNIFMKYNTPLPSSAPVEGLFSFSAVSNRQQRRNLTDEHFEQLVIMKANKIG